MVGVVVGFGTMYELSQADWDAKLYTTTKGLVDLDTAQDSKLNGIEGSATADQNGGEIKALYEAELSAFTDALHTKLGGVEIGAQVNIGEEFTTAEQTKVSKLSGDKSPLEIAVFDSAPASPETGDIYYDSTESSYKRYSGAVWQTVVLSVNTI